MLKRQKKEIERQESQHIQQFKARLKYVKTQQVCMLMWRCGEVFTWGDMFRQKI